MGQLKHKLDARTGVIRITGQGVYSLAQVTEHFDALAKTVARVRSEHGRVKVLVDTSHGAVQPTDVADMIDVATRSLYGPNDRVALIVASMLHKVQMRRVTDPSITSLFRSEHAALTWLCAYDDEARLDAMSDGHRRSAIRET